MLFNSLQFLVFFVVVVFLYYLTPNRFRWVVLLAASYYFYACWNVHYLSLILICTAINYFSALMMAKKHTKAEKKPYLYGGVGLSLFILFVFKYFNFFNQAIREGFRFFDFSYGVSSLELLLPIGISFFTFQSLSYTIDVYRGEREPVKHFGLFALYVSFFPQLVAGPIERSNNLLPQLSEKQEFNLANVKDGVRLMAWGFFKKLVIADRLSIYVNEVYNNVDAYQGTPIIVATYFFAIQIYCDFSGYSDIAIGASRVMGYRLMNNFDNPYHASSFSGFWARWHISLSTWFRDYLFIPIGGSRFGQLKRCRNLIIVFVVSALWHGANWTFLIWGCLHVTYLIVEIYSKNLINRLASRLKRIGISDLFTFFRALVVFHLVVIAWLFFRAGSLNDAFSLIDNTFKKSIDLDDIIISAIGSYEFYIAVFSIFFMELIQLFSRRQPFDKFIASQHITVRWSIVYAIIVGTVIFGQFELTEFIYFQF